MMPLLITFLFLLIISSGSIFTIAFFNKRYEEVFPVTCVGLIAFTFLSGIVNLLEIGALLALVISILLVLVSLFKVLKDKKAKEFLKNFFTPGFFIYVFFTLIFYVAICGKLFDTCDEFSHWGDVVKVMCQMGVFGCGDGTHSLFKSYPPAMSLFQYIFERLNYYITGNNFEEWLCYMAYNLLSIGIFLPYTRDFTFRHPVKGIAFAVVLFTVPFTFYEAAYSSVYIDMFIGMLIAAGAIELMTHNSDDNFSVLRICSIIFLLTLSKDSGLLFAGAFVVAAVLLNIIRYKKDFRNKRYIGTSLAYALSFGLSKGLWQLTLKINRVGASIANKVDMGQLIDILLRRDNSYRKDVLRNFVEAYLEAYNAMGELGVDINYVVLFAIFVTGFVFLYYYIEKNRNEYKTNAMTVGYTVAVSSVVYIIGMCIAYMFNFSEQEALSLASFQRYIRVVYIGMYLFLYISAISLIESRKISTMASCVIMTVALAVVPMNSLFTYVTGAYTKASIHLREEQCGDIVAKTFDVCGENSKIWYINQPDTGDVSLVFRFSVRPNTVGGENSIGTEEYEDDFYLTEMSAKEWIENLINEEYDYVVLHELSEHFKDNYQSLFEKPEKIDEDCIYQVDRATKKLVLVAD